MHNFLGMTLDFSVDGEYRVQQISHMDDMVSNFIEEISQSMALTLASSSLYARGGGGGCC